MVKFITPWEVVNGMSAARQRGHGWVTPYLESVGVPRSTAYRWDHQLRWLAEFGSRELRRLREERDALAATLVDELAPAALTAPLSPQRERALILEAATQGSSDTEIARLLVRAGGRSLSHQTIHATIAEASALARVAFSRYFAGRGRVGAADEIFLGNDPLLLVVAPLSLLISGLRLAPARGAEDWKLLLDTLTELEFCASDSARGLTKALEDAQVGRVADMFHCLRQARTWLARFETRCEAKERAAQKAQARLERSLGKRGRPPTAAARRCAEAAEAAVAEWCRLGDLLEQVAGLFDYVTPKGTLNTVRRATASLADILRAMRRTADGRALAAKLRGLEREPAFAHLAVIEAGVTGLRLEQVGPAREAELARLVAETVAWRRKDKDPVAILEAASTGSAADKLEIAVIHLVDLAIRSSSYVECVNGRIRTVQVSRKRLSEDFLYLLALRHNMTPFGRGSVRAGRTAAELAGIDLPTTDWIELLDLTAEELAKAA